MKESANCAEKITDALTASFIEHMCQDRRSDAISKDILAKISRTCAESVVNITEAIEHIEFVGSIELSDVVISKKSLDLINEKLEKDAADRVIANCRKRFTHCINVMNKQFMMILAIKQMIEELLSAKLVFESLGLYHKTAMEVLDSIIEYLAKISSRNGIIQDTKNIEYLVKFSVPDSVHHELFTTQTMYNIFHTGITLLMFSAIDKP